MNAATDGGTSFWMLRLSRIRWRTSVLLMSSNSASTIMTDAGKAFFCFVCASRRG